MQGKLLPCSPPIKKARETGPGFFIGGGENRTLVLGKRYIDDYMLSAFLLNRPCRKALRLGPIRPFCSRTPAKTARIRGVHTKMYDGGTLKLSVRSQATG